MIITETMIEACARAHFEDQHKEIYDALMKDQPDVPYRMPVWNSPEMEYADGNLFGISAKEWHRRKARCVLQAAFEKSEIQEIKTDFELFLEMIQRAQERGRMHTVSSACTVEIVDEEKKSITIYAGYIGFFTSILFEEDGSLSEISAWE